MSKADQLGAGRFGAGTQPISARRSAIGAATGVPTDGVAPPSRLPVQRISLNPDNPRTTLGDLTELAESLKEHGQKQAITIMNRDAYVKANPGRENELQPDTTHVVVDGSSRLAAARTAGLTHVNVMVDDTQGGNADEIMESALVANIHRQDLEPLDEARALQRLLAIHGTQTALAARLKKSQGWVSQRLALLNLTPELQGRVGQEPIELLRKVGNKPADRQEAALDELKKQASDETQKTQRRGKKPTRPESSTQGQIPPPANGTEYYGVIGDPGATGDTNGPVDTSTSAPADSAATEPDKPKATSNRHELAEQAAKAWNVLDGMHKGFVTGDLLRHARTDTLKAIAATAHALAEAAEKALRER